MILLTRAQLRERIRRDRLGILTPLGENLSTAAEGDPPTWQPDPNNDTINAAIEESLAELNQEIFFSGSNGQVPLAVTVQTANGPYRVQNLITAIPGYTAVGQVNNISHVQWTPTSGPSVPLLPKTFLEMRRDFPDYNNTPPAVPSHYIIDSYDLYTYPAPVEAGTLYMLMGLSMLSPTDDTDYIGQLPADFNPLVMDMAAVRAGRTVIGDVEMQARVALILPAIAEGKKRLKVWYISQMQDRQAGVTHRSTRPYFTGRRR